MERGLENGIRTFKNGVKIKEGRRRPRVIIDMKLLNKSKWLILTIANTYRFKGNKHKMILGLIIIGLTI